VIRSVVVGWGAELPGNPVTNDDLVARGVETSDAWIAQRTGIRQRYIADAGITTSTLAFMAAQRALAKAGVPASSVDMLIVATTTPDQTFPSTATRVQGLLGMDTAPAFDVQAVCSGFVYALSIADSFIRCGQARRVLVIGAETFSRLLDWSDRNTCVLFGDGAGALLLEAAEGEGTMADRGVLSSRLYADGSKNELLCMTGGPSSTQDMGHLQMTGREVFRWAVQRMAESAILALEEAGISPDQVDWLVPHQANIRILQSTAERIGIPEEKVIITVEHHGNTSAASIPLALCEAAENGKIKAGQLLLLEAMGGGFTWGSALLRW